jgi:hypothetical protein
MNMNLLKISSVFLLALLFSSCGGKAPKSEKQSDQNPVAENTKSEKHKYGVKSGIIEYSTKMMGMDMTQTLYFDDYGALEATEMEMDMMGTKTHTVNITKEGYVYSLDLITKTGTRQMIFNKEANIDFKNLSKEMEKKMNLKKIGKEDFAGKTCEKYSIDYTDLSMKGYYLVWEGIALKTDVDMGSMKMEMIAKNVQENVNIPAAKFEIPADFQITEQ